MTPAPQTKPRETPIEGYASLFWRRDLNDDVVARGAFADSLARRPAPRLKMLHQHDPKDPIGVWDQAQEDASGLYVRGRIIDATPQASFASAMVRAGMIDGLSIGFRKVKARRSEDGRLRILSAVELIEVSLVTFPMLAHARLVRPAAPNRSPHVNASIASPQRDQAGRAVA